MKVFTGLTGNTRKNLQLDAGALFKNYNPATDTPESASAKLIGATVGGSTLSIVPEVRQIAVDGVKGPTKGYEAIDSWTVTLTTNIKEVTVDSVKLMLAAAVSTTTNTSTTSPIPAGYTKINLKELEDSDYIDNITWIGRISGSDSPIMIVIRNAINLNGFSMQAQDKNEGQLPAVFTAHYDVSDLEDVPVDIYIPNQSA